MEIIQGSKAERGLATEGEKYPFSSESETIINLHHLLWYV
jgi:hypothetical protein